MPAFISYDWLDTTDDSIVPRGIGLRSDLKDDLASIDSIDSGIVVFQNSANHELAFTPLSVCKFATWITQQCSTLIHSTPVFLIASEANIVFDTDGDSIRMCAYVDSVTAEWHRFLGESLSVVSGRRLVTAHRLLVPQGTISNVKYFPGKIAIDLSIKTIDWISCVIDIGKQFQTLVLEAKNLLSQNAENYRAEHRKELVDLAFDFADKFPAICDKIEWEGANKS